MAWRSSGSSNATLVRNLVANKVIVTDRVEKAMLAVDRGHYAPDKPYMDAPQGIGYRATISAPHMHASACESLLPYLQPGANVLDVGSGSGYLTHVFAELVKPGGQVTGVDHVDGLVRLATTNMRKTEDGQDLLESGTAKFITADGRLGYSAYAPFDAIHVGAAAAEHHAALTDQLKSPGRLFVPVEDAAGGDQHVWVIDKRTDGTLERMKLFGVRYVPLGALDP